MHFKSGLTNQAFQELKSSFQSSCSTFLSKKSAGNNAFVYVDDHGVKYLAETLNSEDDVFAISIAEDGYMEMLAFSEN